MAKVKLPSVPMHCILSPGPQNNVKIMNVLNQHLDLDAVEKHELNDGYTLYVLHVEMPPDAVRWIEDYCWMASFTQLDLNHFLTMVARGTPSLRIFPKRPKGQW